MKPGKMLLDRVVRGADLSMESLPGQPLIEIIGNHRVIIENHCGVTQYQCNEICVKVPSGVVRVSGALLALAQMTKERLVISGQIDSVHLHRGGRQWV